MLLAAVEVVAVAVAVAVVAASAAAATSACHCRLPGLVEDVGSLFVHSFHFESLRLVSSRLVCRCVCVPKQPKLIFIL